MGLMIREGGRKGIHWELGQRGGGRLPLHTPLLQKSGGLRALALRGTLHWRSNGLDMGKEVLLAAFIIFHYCLPNLRFS